MRSVCVFSVVLVLGGIQPAAADALFYKAENQVPVAMVEVVRAVRYTEVHLQTQTPLTKVCWTSAGADSPYLLADGRRYRFLDGDGITACPNRRDYDARAVTVLRFEPLETSVHEFSLVESQGGENQLVDPASSKARYWNFLHVRLN